MSDLKSQPTRDAKTDPIGIPVGHPVGHPAGQPTGQPISATIGHPIGAAIGLPIGAALGNPISTYVGNADRFPVLRKWDFFNHAGVAPLPRIAAEAMARWAREAELGAYLSTTWYQDVAALRRSAAALINADSHEVAFVKNTSEGISIVASGIDWQWGDRIVTTAVEYPANIYPWMEVVRSRGARLVMVEEITRPDGRREVPLEKILEEAKDPRTRIVTLSHVEYASGQRHDLAKIGAYCRVNKKLLCVDAIQSLGVLPVDVKAMNIDYLSADGHKWLLGPEGAGIFYCRKELIDRTRPLMIGWMNVVDAMNHGNYDYTLKPDSGRFECGSYNVAGLLGLKASLELLAGVGVDAIAQRVQSLGDRLIEGLERKGYKIVSPRTADQWSGIVGFVSPVHGHDQIQRALRRDHHIELAVREHRLRCSPHFYNTESQIDRLIEMLPGH
jgi:selenocysteine lyase/cysteine desulfurase